MNEPKQVVSAQNRLGETPIWEPEENALYWVDWGGLPTCRFEPDTGKFIHLSGDCPGDFFGEASFGRLGCHRPGRDIRLDAENQ